MNRETSPKPDSEIILEQYKVYNDSITRLYSSWSQTDRLYLSVLSGLFAAIAFIMNIYKTSPNIFFAIKFIGLISFILALSWYLYLVSYIKIRNRKLAVLQEIESKLPVQCFIQELKLGERIKTNPYSPHIENFVPITVMVIALCLLFFPVSGFLAG
jgi:hypothetical protein